MPPQLIIHNAHLYAPHSGSCPTAVAVTHNRISFVGSDAEALALRDGRTRVVDAHGRTLLPGLIDSHFHLMHGALGFGQINCRAVRSIDDLADRVHAYAAAQPDLPWLVGQGMAYRPILDRHVLDRIEPHRPLAVMAFDVHTLWANTAALQQAGLLHGADNLPGSAEIVRGDDGLASGELRERAAFDLLLDHVPAPDDARRRQLVRDALAYLARLGLTAVHNMDGTPAQAAFYAALEDAGELTLRVRMPYDITPQTELRELAEIAAPMRDRFSSDLLTAGSVKFFMDGVFESWTAVTVNDYPDRPGFHGDPIFDAEQYAALVTEADRLGLQVITHACGDGAVRRALDGYARARQANGRRDSRHRVEHIELIHPDDVGRFAELDVIAAMQPLHAPLSPNPDDVWISRIRPDDLDRAFAWRTLRAAGATLPYGSDWPVADPSPLLGIAAALNRRPVLPGANPHTQTLAEALDSYTRAAAFAEFAEQERGSLRPGYLADLVLLDADLFDTAPADIGALDVALTVCNGRVTYEKPHVV